MGLLKRITKANYEGETLFLLESGTLTPGEGKHLENKSWLLDTRRWIKHFQTILKSKPGNRSSVWRTLLMRQAINKHKHTENMKTKQEIIPSTRRRTNGWQATLEFPNGGIQAFASLYYSHEEALEAAKGLLKNRLRYPESCIPDPSANILMEL